MMRILKNLHSQVMTDLGKAALGSWDAYHLKKVLDGIEYQMATYTATAKTELSGLLDTAWSAGKHIVDAPLSSGGIYMGYHLPTSILDSLKNYSSDYLQSMAHDAWYKIKGEINLGMIGGKTPHEVTQAIGQTLDAGRFKQIKNRAETITKTEMGRVASEATQLRMGQAAEHVKGLEKEWIHAGHPRTPRPSHVAASGQHIPVHDAFQIGGVAMMFPRDPKAPIEETIHCGCDHVPWHENWK
jgi:hypothetical protein